MKKYILATFYIVFSLALDAAPYFGQIQNFEQPDGSIVKVKLYGDEYYMRGESIDGYTLIRDTTSGYLCYAQLSDKRIEFVSTGIVYTGDSLKDYSSRLSFKLQKHLELPQEQIALEINKNEEILKGKNGIRTKYSGNLQARPTTADGLPAPESGVKKGLTILVDFSDRPQKIGISEVEKFLNGDGYTGYGNNGSVKEYFKDISGGLYIYENVVVGYYRAPKTFAEYDAMDYTKGAQEILGNALQWVEDNGFDFSSLSLDQDGNVLAINLMHTGVARASREGMWPHRSWYDGFSADGVKVSNYNTSFVDSTIELATICHENGHMLFNWPDFYKSGDNQSDPDGMGAFDLMTWYGSTKNPVPPNPFLRATMGWLNVVNITSYNGTISDEVDSKTIYKYKKSNNEYFLLEARLKTGRSAVIPDEGLTIWHIKEDGDNAARYGSPPYYQVLLKHANNNIQDHTGACWHQGGNITFNDNTTPNARWYDNSTSGLKVWNIGAIGSTMTYNVGDATPVKDCNGVLGGLAFIDDCMVCAGGNTGIIPNSSCPTYCIAAGSNETGGGYIVNVTFGGINQSSGKTTYSDFTNVEETFSPCQTFDLTVKLQGAFSGDVGEDKGYVWIDWNNDGVFYVNEMIQFPTYSNNTSTLQVTIPKGVVGKRRMRVRNVFDWKTIDWQDVSSCGSFLAGEVEDYSINVTSTGSLCGEDCNGIVDGSAYYDDCDVCVGGNTGKTACNKDCNNVWGGTAYLDSCNLCVGGNTNLTACTKDCNNQWGGKAYIDDCNKCAGGSTEITPCCLFNANAAGSISGANILCKGDISSYSIDEVAHTTLYTWTIPSGATITSGQGTRSITVNFSNASSGDVLVTPSNSCSSGAPSKISVTVNTPLAPVNLGTDVELCKPSSVTLNAGSVDGADYNWTRNGSASGNEPSLLVVDPGTYKVTVSKSNSKCPSVSDEIVVTSTLPNANHDTICETGTVNLSITGDGSYSWYDVANDGAPLTSGNSYSTFINQSTAFYVEDKGTFEQYIGPDINNHSLTNVQQSSYVGIYFTAFAPFQIKEMKVYPFIFSCGYGNDDVQLTLDLKTASGTLIQSYTATALPCLGTQSSTNGAKPYLMVFDTPISVSQPGEYILQPSAGSILFWYQAGADYPNWGLDGVVTLTQDTETWKTGSCPGMFDIKISSQGSACDRTLVYGVVNPNHTTCLPADCNGNIGGTAYLDDCNKCVGGNTNKTACTVTAIQDNANAYSVNIFPNPSQGQFDISLNIEEDVNLTVIDNYGKIIHSQIIYANGELINQKINLENKASGVYYVKINSDNITFVQKLIIENN